MVLALASSNSRGVELNLKLKKHLNKDLKKISGSQKFAGVTSLDYGMRVVSLPSVTTESCISYYRGAEH